VDVNGVSIKNEVRLCETACVEFQPLVAVTAFQLVGPGLSDDQPSANWLHT